GIPLHVAAVQVVGHRLVDADALGVDLLSCTAHKLGGPRGIGLLLRRRGVGLLPLIGGAQEGGLRGGTEAVVLAAGFVQALEEAHERLRSLGGLDPLAALRDPLLARLLELPGVSLSGPAPEDRDGRLPHHSRLPHHISLVVTSVTGVPLPGRELVRGLWRQAGLDPAARARIDLPADGPALPSSFRVDTAAQVSIAAATLAAAEMWRRRGGPTAGVVVPMRHASLEFR
ncbi:MAG: aminotransferase class V-fold PLP-dependent enzyme, partial [Cyanobium sp.]